MFVIRRLPILEYIVSSTNAHRASKEGKKAIEPKVENITACIRSRTFVYLPWANFSTVRQKWA